MNEEQELPQGWETAKLDEVMTPVRGIAFPKEVKAHAPAEGHIACLRTTNVQKEVEWGDLWFIPRQYAKRDDQIIQPLDILISTANSYELVGKVAQVHAIPHQATLGAFISLLRVKAPFDAKFFYHYLSASATQEAIRGFASTTTNISNVSTGKLATLDVVVPPLPEQRRIVAKLEELFSKLDAGVAAVRRTQALLKRYRQSVLHAAVTGELTRAWRETHPTPPTESGAALLQRIRAERRAQWEAAQVAKRGGQLPLGEGWKSKYVEPEALDTSKLPELPTGWTWASMRQLGEVRLGRQRAPQHHSGPYMRPYLRVANVYEDRFDLRDVMEMNFTPEEYETYALRENDILLNEGQSLELVGRPALYRNEVPGACFTNTLVRFRVYQNVLPVYALSVFRSYLHNGEFQKIASWTTSIAHLGADRFAGLHFPLPPLLEQAEIVAEVERRLTVLDALSQTLTHELKRAERLRQSILHQAFTGRLVPQDAIDEPAATLLARLREIGATSAKSKVERGRKSTGLSQIGFSF